MKRTALSVLSLICCAMLFAQVSTISSSNNSSVSLGGSGSGEVSAVENTNVQLAISNPDYMVTPGDIYTLAFVINSGSSTTTITYQITVDSTYKIRVANLAVLDASGKSYVTLKKQVEDIVTKNYPMSGVQFSLMSPSNFTVQIKGEVKNSTVVTTWALARLSTVVQSSLTEYSSVRDIQIRSASGKVATYDLFKANREGDLSQNPYMRPGDVIIVSPLDRKITLSGSVKRPGTYELLKGENIKELIEYYGGGFSVLADSSRIEVTRINSPENPSGVSLYLSKTDVDANFELKAYDSVSVVSIDSFHPIMFMEGAVASSSNGTALTAANKITVQFNTNTNYAYLLRSHKDWFSSSVADKDNAYIIRGEQVIPINITRLLYDSSAESELTVEPYDTLRIPFKQFYVQVSGSVYGPGRYPYVPDRTYEYYVSLAGGFVQEKNKRNSVKITDADGKRLEKTDIITPETVIVANANSFTYFFNQYAPIISTILSIISSFITTFTLIRTIK